MPTSPSLASRVLEILEHDDLDDASGAAVRIAVRKVVLAHLIAAEQAVVAAPGFADGTDTSRILSVTADIAVALERIAENTGHADLVITEDAALSAWDHVGMRMNQEKVVPFLERLGIRVEQ
jgi:hypothetical protein